MKLFLVCAIGVAILGYAVYEMQSFGKGTYRGPAPSNYKVIGNRSEYYYDSNGRPMRRDMTWYRRN